MTFPSLRTAFGAALAAMSLAAALPAAANDFSEGSNARTWNLFGEAPALFDAKVVDMLCEVAGDCTKACAPGRQLGLLRVADGVLVLPTKNSQPAFTGAAVELAPFCNKDVEVDGLLITDDYFPIENIYLIQKIRVQGTQEWTRANRWTKEWAANHPEAKGKGPWFRRDPRIGAIIEDRGYLGNGMSHQEAWDATQ
ncbi:MAG: hypothetical protein AAF631_10910 [Pseudomonadota bacterium]